MVSNMPKLEVTGAALNYEIWGGENARSIVLVNGHLRPLNDFRTLGKNLVQEGWRVVVYDNRGSGQTTYESAFSMSDLVIDLAMVIDQLAGGTCALLGISMGGMIAMQYAINYAASLQSLILISTTAHYQHFLPGLQVWPTDEAGILQALSRYVNPDFFTRNQVLMRSMAKQMAKSLTQPQGKNEGTKWQRQSTRNFDCVKHLPTIQTPSTIIHGERDEIIAAAAAQELQMLIPNAELHILKGLGHLLLIEGFQELKKIVMQAVDNT